MAVNRNKPERWKEDVAQSRWWHETTRLMEKDRPLQALVDLTLPDSLYQDLRPISSQYSALRSTKMDNFESCHVSSFSCHS